MNQVWRVFVPFVDWVGSQHGGAMVTMNDQAMLELAETLLENPKVEARVSALIADKLDARYRLLRELDDRTRLEEQGGVR